MRHLSCAETAKLVRAELTRSFPGTVFSVRSKSYSGGASITVGWTDGPLSRRVDAVLSCFEGKRFDGSIDLACYNDAYLLPDGSVEFAHTEGTEGSMGSIPRADAPRPIRGELVHFGADYVFSRREITNEAAIRAIAERYIREHCGCKGEAPNDWFGNDRVSDLARSLVFSIDYTEPGSELERFERAYHRAIFREEPEEATHAA